MFISKNSRSQAVGELRLFGNIRVLAVAAVFIAISVAGKQLSFTAGLLRFGFETLTVLMAGIMLGPFIGAAVGACADIIGCIMVGYAINPVITLGACCVGFISGIVSHTMFKENKALNIAVSIAAARIVGSLIINSIAFYIYFHYPLKLILLRIPSCAILGVCEFYIIYMIMNNKAFANQLERMCKK